MITPRLEIDLDKIRHNASTLVELLAGRGISVTGVTKATLGSGEIAGALLGAGFSGLGDSRIENIEALRREGVSASMTLIRSPMLSQVERVVAHADLSFNTELDVISKLSSAAQEAGRTHAILLMVELGDLREGILPGDLEHTVRETLRFPNIALEGIGTNLACQSGVSPNAENMAELSRLADSIEAVFGPILGIVSGGNSANLPWALGTANTGRINNLRLGEAVLLGREPLHRQAIEGLHTDAITLVAEVIESKIKPSKPWGEIARSAFGVTSPRPDRGMTPRAILALGHQDVDPDGIEFPIGFELLGASSDHLILTAEGAIPAVGDEVRLQLNYSALVRAMTSLFVARVLTGGSEPHPRPNGRADRTFQSDPAPSETSRR